MRNLVIATTVTVAGEAYAHNAMGELRVLDVGDELCEGETILTSEGCEVRLKLLDGSELVVHESSRREISRQLVAESRPRLSAHSSTGLVGRRSSVARFSDLHDGAAVSGACGRNLFFNEKPLYWSVDQDKTRAAAIAHVTSGTEFVDHIAFQVRLGGEESCMVSVSEGEFALESHNIPFTTGEPEPGFPVKFFGIADNSAIQVENPAGEGGAMMSAEIGSIGVTNTWSREGGEVVFAFGQEYLNDEGEVCVDADAGPRTINNFTFRNTGRGDAAFVARAYRGSEEQPVYCVGSAAAPLRIAAGGVFSVVSHRHYDRLVVAPVNDSDGSRTMSLHLEGYSEFHVQSIPFSLQVTGVGPAGEIADGSFEFEIDRHGEGHGELRFVTESTVGNFDSVWEKLGLQSGGDPREQH